MYMQIPTNTGLQLTPLRISAYVKNSVPAFILKKHEGVYAPIILKYRQKDLCHTIMRR